MILAHPRFWFSDNIVPPNICKLSCLVVAPLEITITESRKQEFAWQTARAKFLLSIWFLILSMYIFHQKANVIVPRKRLICLLSVWTVGEHEKRCSRRMSCEFRWCGVQACWWFRLHPLRWEEVMISNRIYVDDFNNPPSASYKIVIFFFSMKFEQETWRWHEAETSSNRKENLLGVLSSNLINK